MEIIKEKKPSDLTKGNIFKLVLTFTLPIILGNLFQQFYSMADTIIVGNTLGINALAALGATSSLNFFFICFASGLSLGFSVMVGQKMGAKDYVGVKKAIASGIKLSAIIGITLSIVAAALTKPLLILLRTPEEIYKDAFSYLFILFAGIWTILFYNLFANVLRALGDSKIPLYFLIMAALLNVVLDLVFIIIFKMGVAGAAYATVISQFLSCLGCYVYAKRKYDFFRLTREDFKNNKNLEKIHLKTGFPMGLQMSVIGIGLIVLQIVLNGFGANYIAAYTAATKVDNIGTSFILSFGAASSSFSSQNYGAGDYKRVEKCIFVCTIYGIFASLIFGAICIPFADNLITLFMDSAPQAEVDNIIYLGKLLLFKLIPFYPTLSLICVFRNSIQSIGNNIIPFVACILELISRSVLSIVLGKYFGYSGVCWCTPLAWAISGFFLLIAYFCIRKNVYNPKIVNKFVIK